MATAPMTATTSTQAPMTIGRRAVLMRSDERRRHTDGFVGGLDQSARARVGRQVLVHLVHDVPEADLVHRVGEADGTAGAGMTEVPLHAVRGKRGRREEPETERRLEEQALVVALGAPGPRFVDLRGGEQ